MFATGPANNCCVEFATANAYGSIATVKGMENIRRLEVMLDLELLGFDSSASNIPILTDSNTGLFCFIDVDYNGLTSTPMSGLRAAVNRNTQQIATPANTTPLFGKRMNLWLKDDQSTITFRTNGLSGTGITYTATEAAAAIVSPAGPITIGRIGNTPKMRLYEAAIRVNGSLVFHVRPRLYMAETATPATIPDLSPYGNDMTVGGTHGTDFRYIPSWSRQVPFSGRENVG